MALESLEILRELLEDADVDDRRLVVGYLETKRMLADSFERFAIERYSDPSAFESVRALLDSAMQLNFDHIPIKYRRVRGFGQVHGMLYGYLKRRVGEEVRSDELRMLTGDAVHTERRARDLRTLGFRLDARESSGQQVYLLHDSLPDILRGSEQMIAKNIRDDKGLAVGERSRLLGLLNA